MTTENDIEDFDTERDVEALRRHAQRLLGEKKKLAARVPELEAPKEQTPREKWIREQVKRLTPFTPGSEEYKAEFVMIEGEMQTLIDAEIAQHESQRQGELKRLSTQHDRIYVEHAARRIASELCTEGHDAALLPHIIGRLGVESRDGTPALIVLDAEGKPSSATVDALKRELRETPAFKPVLRDAVEDEAAHQRKVREMLGDTEGAARKQLTRSAFDRLSGASQAHHVRQGGEVVDDVH
jgi:hypothetical protein